MSYFQSLAPSGPSHWISEKSQMPSSSSGCKLGNSLEKDPLIQSSKMKNKPTKRDLLLVEFLQEHGDSIKNLSDLLFLSGPIKDFWAQLFQLLPFVGSRQCKKIERRHSDITQGTLMTLNALHIDESLLSDPIEAGNKKAMQEKRHEDLGKMLLSVIFGRWAALKRPRLPSEREELQTALRAALRENVALKKERAKNWPHNEWENDDPEYVDVAEVDEADVDKLMPAMSKRI